MEFNMAGCFYELNLDINAIYNIKYMQKNYRGSIEINTLNNINSICDGMNIFDSIFNFRIYCYHNISNSDSEFELLLCKCKTNNNAKYISNEYFISNIYDIDLGRITLFKQYYDIYMMIDCDKEKILNKLVSYHLPIRFEDGASGDLLVDIYNIYPYINIVFRKLIYTYESISLIQTIKCNCNKVKHVTDSFNKAINSCGCFIKENIKRLKPIRVNIRELDKLFKLLKINPHVFIVKSKSIKDNIYE